MKRVLLLTHRVPYPPDRGDRIRSYHLLRYLSRTAEVSLACVAQESIPANSEKALREFCRDVAIAPTSASGRVVRDLWSVARGRSATEGHFWSPLLAATVSDWARSKPFDAVVCFCSGMYRYARLPELAETPTLVDLVDVDSEKWVECAREASFPKKAIYKLESQRVRELERQICRQAGSVCLISSEEKELLQKCTNFNEAIVAQNGVDLEYFSPSFAGTPLHSDFCFVGVLDYPPNVDAMLWFTEQVWPAVRKQQPKAKLNIVGKSPTKSIQLLNELPGVSVHKNVPDVRPYLAGAGCVVAPLRIARGVQNKVLEAMAMGKAVVASPNALSGINAQQGRDLLVASDAAQWVQTLVSLPSPQASRELQSNARRFVEQQHDWSTCLAPFGELLNREPQQRLSRVVDSEQQLTGAAI